MTRTRNRSVVVWAAVRPALVGAALLTLFTISGTGADRPQAPPSRDVTELTLEELMNVDVTSVSKKNQKLSQTPAAVYVVTREQIRRSGHASIPEVLRGVPGLHVARIDAEKWAISARGFNGLFSNKLLVLVDGRSVYSPLFSGVYWGLQDMALGDVERIEVIRGPGAAVWGANAVNGVINIITRPAADTLGGSVTVAAGSDQIPQTSIRYGAQLRENIHLRGNASHTQLKSLEYPNDPPDVRNHRISRGGFRLDWSPSSRDSVTFQGDMYRARTGQRVAVPIFRSPFLETRSDQADSVGGHLLASATRKWSESSESRFHFYFDRFDRTESLVGYVRNTYDIELQHRWTPIRRHDVMIGFGYRLTDDSITHTSESRAHPASRVTQLLSGFVNDEVMLVENRLSLTLGTKLEQNDFTGLEVQPNARLLWTASRSHAFWAAGSRAVRLPTRADHNIDLNAAVIPTPFGLPALISFVGNTGFRSEVLNAIEGGYRTQPAKWLSLDVATFLNEYRRLASTELAGNPVPVAGNPPHLLVPLTFGNNSKARTAGIEVSALWAPVETWRLSTNYSAIRVKLGRNTPNVTGLPDTVSVKSPTHQMSASAQWDVSRKVQFDTMVYYVGELRSFNVPDRVRLDFRLGWRPAERVDISAGVQNLLNRRHVEFVPEALFEGAAVRRNAYVRVTFGF